MKKQFIYNPRQARFFIDKGCRVISVGVNGNTGKPYTVFYREELSKYFDEWIKQHPIVEN